jgi:hypothetical protein
MALLLAIEPDNRQASFVTALAKDPLGAELILTTSTDDALKALDERVPDLILTSLLLSPSDDSALTARLRELDAVGKHVQTLVIPLLADPTLEVEERGGLLQRLGWRKPKAAGSPDGCSPAVFAAQITEYLNRRNIHRVFAHLHRSSLSDEALSPNGSHDQIVVHTEAVEPAKAPPIQEEVTPPVVESAAAAPAEAFGTPAHVEIEDPPAPPAWLRTPSRRAPIPLKAVEEPLPSIEPVGLILDSPSVDAGQESLLVAAAEVDAISTDPVDPQELLRGAESETPEFETVFDLPDEEPVVSVPSIRPDLLEMLEEVRHDLETLRSAPEHRAMIRARQATGSVQDEWGFFDPQQCGMSALLAKLEQIAQEDLTAAASD